MGIHCQTFKSGYPQGASLQIFLIKKEIIMKQEELNFSKNENFNLTMIPGKFARKMRTFIVWQFFRFLVINIKMLIVVSKSH